MNSWILIGFCSVVPLMEIVPLEHPRDIVMRAQMDQRFRGHRTHPPAVELHQGLRRIENFEDLPLVGFGIFQHLLLRKRDARLRLAGRITDHAGEIADQEDHLMSEFLKVLELVDQDRMAQMQIRRGRIEACFHA